MYEVGQTVYTILDQQYKVMPLKISEQIITKTLEGEKTVFKAILPGKNDKKVLLSKLTNIWTDLEEVKQHMIDNASTAIDNMLTETVQLQEKYFGAIEENIACNEEINNDTIKSDQQTDNKIIKVDLGNGQIGNLKIDNSDLGLKKK